MDYHARINERHRQRPIALLPAKQLNQTGPERVELVFAGGRFPGSTQDRVRLHDELIAREGHERRVPPRLPADEGDLIDRLPHRG